MRRICASFTADGAAFTSLGLIDKEPFVAGCAGRVVIASEARIQASLAIVFGCNVVASLAAKTLGGVIRFLAI